MATAVPQSSARPLSRELPRGLSLLRPVFAADVAFSAWIQARRSPQLDRAASVFKCLGDGRYILPPLALLYAYGLNTDSSLATETAVTALSAFLIAGLLGQALIALTRRHRPCNGEGPDVFDGPSWRGKNRSFPSGHATVAWAVFGVIGLQLSAWPLVTVVAFALATLVGFSRLNDHAHWPSDVLVATILGLGTAYLLVM